MTTLEPKRRYLSPRARLLLLQAICTNGCQLEERIGREIFRQMRAPEIAQRWDAAPARDASMLNVPPVDVPKRSRRIVSKLRRVAEEPSKQEEDSDLAARVAAVQQGLCLVVGLATYIAA